jgi:hypothetical protein
MSVSGTGFQRGGGQSARSNAMLNSNVIRSVAPEFKRSLADKPGDQQGKNKMRPQSKNIICKPFDQPDLEPTTEDFRRRSPYSSSFKHEKPIFLGELGDGKLLKHSKNPNSSKVILKTFCPTTTKERDQLIKQVKFYKQLDCASILKVLDFEVRTESAYCSVNYFIDVYLEYFEKTLETAYKERQPSHLLFSNESLERLLYDIGFALHHYCKHSLVHGCVDARHITIQEVEGEIVVAKLLPLIGVEASPLQMYKKHILFQTEHTVAPEIFDQAKLLFKDEFDSTGLDLTKLDSFSLGVVLLRTGLLETVMRIYSKPTFNTEVLDSYLASFQEIFGDGPEGAKLVHAVRDLVQVDYSRRPHPSELLQRLNSIEPSRISRRPEYLGSMTKEVEPQSY